MMTFCVICFIYSGLCLLGGDFLNGIIGVVCFGGYILSRIALESRVDNYDMTKVSAGKMACDTGKSYTEIKRNLVAGKYDKDFEDQF